MTTRTTLMVALLSMFATASVSAAILPEDAARSAGINYGLEHALGVQGEVDISSLVDNAPVAAQVFCKHYLQNPTPGDSWSTTGIGAAVIYDFNSVSRMNQETHPYVGVGVMYIFHSWAGTGPARPYDGVGSGLYLVGGVRYALTPKVAADLNYNIFGDLTAGINYSF